MTNRAEETISNHYFEIVIEVDESLVEPWSDHLMNAGALSVTIEDVHANTENEIAKFGEPGASDDCIGWPLSRLTLLFDQSFDYHHCLHAIAAELNLPLPAISSTKQLIDQDWVRLTQSQFTPIEIGRKIIVIPSWHDTHQENSSALMRPTQIILDPGLAFGTGSHPTTQLCMEWLEDNIKPHDQVLDYGCGSGILSILAKLCGAAHVVGIDVDAQAVQSAKANKEFNNCSIDFFDANYPLEETFDVVIANILSNPLKVIASLLCSKVKKQGYLALSGILERQADEMIAHYQPLIELKIWRQQDGWVCLTGQKL